VISLLLGLYGSAQLPVTVAGVLLLIFGVAMIIAEAHLGTHGILGASGVVALIASGLLLYNTNSSAFGISAPVVIAVGLILGGLLAFAVQRAVQARTQPKRTGWEEMVGAVGEVRKQLDPVGQIFVQGALWRARLGGPNGSDRTLERGSRVRVESVEGLTLQVRPLESGEEAAERAEPSTVPR
jgi:membrane-bound serine protease (ClpP class)